MAKTPRLKTALNLPKKDSVTKQASREPSFLKKVFLLALPFGQFRLGMVFALVLLQGLFQVIGVTSIFPFLALAADPKRIYDSQYGRWFLSFLPEMDNGQLLTVAGVFAIAMLVIANVLNIASEFVRNRYAHDFGHWMRMRLLNRILDQPYGYFLENNSAVLLKKVYSDVMGYITGVLLPLLESTARLVTSVLLIITLLFIHLKIALTAAVGLCGFYAVIYLILKKKREQISRGFRMSWKQCAIELQQLFGGIKPVKVHEVEDNFVERFEAPSKLIAKHASWMPVFMHVPRYVIEPLAFSGLIAIVVYLNIRGRNMTAILPNMGVMALAGYRLLPSLQLLYSQLTQVSGARFTIEEVYEEFQKAENIAPRERIDQPDPLDWNESIRLEEITFYYPADNRVLDNVSLSIKKNTSVAFVGATGSGKSTIIDLITGLHKPNSGRILVDNKPIVQESLSAWRATIGYVPQDVFLTDDSIAGNIAIGIPTDEIDTERLHEAARVAQILDFISDELEDGFETITGERGVRLSGGQRQRIGLARALYRDPSVLIFDEATSALDNETEAEVMAAINGLSHQKTIIMIAHRLSTVSDCDRIYQLENGKVKVADFDQLPI